MRKIRTLVVDDEELARVRVGDLLAKEPDIEIVGYCKSGREAVEALRRDKPDLAFLDVQLRDISGIDVVEQGGPFDETVIIFATAFDAYALRAFDLHALDYLLKPFSDERFQAALERARARIHDRAYREYNDRLQALVTDYAAFAGRSAEPRRTAEGRPPRHDEGEDAWANASWPETVYANRIVIRTGGRKVFIKTEEVDCIEAEGVYVRLHVGTKNYLLRDSLNNVELRMDPNRFVRIHRSMIVNVDRIKEISPHFNGGGVVTLHDGRTFKLSRSYRDRVRVTIG